MEIGPTSWSMRDVHARLLAEHGQVPNVHPLPASLRVAGATLHIHDLWNTTDDDAPAGIDADTSIRAL